MPSADDLATLEAYITGVDQTARAAEAKWGFDRLPTLVSDDLRARFNRQAVKWRTALHEAWHAAVLTRGQLDTVESTSGGMKRAWAALDAAAEEAGARPVQPWVWETALRDGTVVAIVQTDAEVSRVQADGRHVAVYTLAEIANVIDALGVLHMAKVQIPGAKVQPPRDRSWERAGDPIPFGEDEAA